MYRWDISITADERTLEDIEKCASLTTKSRPVNTGIKHKPLIRVALRKVMVDELHLLLRIFDILMNNIVQDTAYQDELQGTKDPLSGPKLNQLVDTIRSLGVAFKVWKSRKTSELDWSSIGGNQRKKLLRLLPQHFPVILSSSSCDMVAKIWKVHTLSHLPF